MRKLFQIIALLQAVDLVIAIDYSEHGSNWPSDCTSGENQSPIDINLESTANSTKILFKIEQFHPVTNATLTNNDGLIEFKNPNISPSNMTVINEYGEAQTFHFSKAQWKIPSEHRIDGKQMSAELQLYHSQFVTNKEVAISFLFDKSLVPVDADPKRLKTCFVDSFEFTSFKAQSDRGRAVDVIEPPLKEFIDFIPQTEMIYYEGSRTTPPCGEDISWFINLKAHVITQEQIDELMALNPQSTQDAGGNYRDKQSINDRKIFKFDNVANLADYALELIAEAEEQEKLDAEKKVDEFLQDSDVELLGQNY